jgi:LytS/YehU family sensor histidine kinase
MIAAKTTEDTPFPLISNGWREDEREPSSAASSRDVRWWGVVCLVWAMLGLVAALQQAATYAMRGALRQEWIWVAMQVPRWLFWVPFTPLIFGACRRFPLARDRLGRSLLAHLGLAAFTIVLVEGGYAQLSLAVERLAGSIIAPDRPAALVLTAISVLTRLVSGVVTYAAVVGVASALDSQRRLRDRDSHAARLEADLARAQVQAIKMQVQPHFLFNTLHAINVLILEDPAVATRMVTLLGDLLRQTLSRAMVEKVSLRSELEVLALYLDIQSVRFRDRLKVAFDVPEATLSALVPDLVLQPLAENAITHGVGALTDGGTVRISARREGDTLILDVVDTGDGPMDDKPPRERIGLSTVRARLERLYGANQALTVGPAPGGGCLARISLPFQEP